MEKCPFCGAEQGDYDLINQYPCSTWWIPKLMKFAQSSKCKDRQIGQLQEQIKQADRKNKAALNALAFFQQQVQELEKRLEALREFIPIQEEYHTRVSTKGSAPGDAEIINRYHKAKEKLKPLDEI